MITMIIYMRIYIIIIVKNYEKIIAQIDLNKKNIKGQGKKSIFIAKENELIIYIEELRIAKLAFNTNIIIAKMISLELN